MKRMIFTIILLLSGFLGFIYSQESMSLPMFPADFKEEAFKHVKDLSSMGIRYVNSEGEKKTIKYLKDFFSKNNLTTSIDTFKFHYIDFKDIIVKINDHSFTPITIGTNPDDAAELSGDGYIASPGFSVENYFKQNLNGKIVISTSDMNPFLLAQNKTIKGIIFLNQNDFNSIKDNNNLKVNLRAKVEQKILESYNISAVIFPKVPSEKEIIISAHWDACNGPGADDNATGVGVMMELAKYFNSIKDSLRCRIRAAAFGAEELGILGSYAFVQKHIGELKNCMLVFNLDEVGGKGNTYIEMRGGVENVPAEFDASKVQTGKTIFSVTDYQRKWFNLGFDFPSLSNVPDWLKNYITKSCSDQNIKFVEANGMGTDHQNFYPAGIVATSICIPTDGSFNHSAKDVPDNIDLNSLEASGKVVASVVLKTMKK